MHNSDLDAGNFLSASGLEKALAGYQDRWVQSGFPNKPIVSF